MRRLVVTLLIGLVGAGIVHIVAVLGAPSMIERTAFVRIGELGGDGRFVALPQPDPFLRGAACRFSLDRPVRIEAGGGVPFWSASVFSGDGVNLYSLNDRTTPDGALNLVIVEQDQFTTIREALVNDSAEIVPLRSNSAIVVLRTLVPNDTLEADALLFLQAATCNVLDPTSPIDEG